LNALPTAVRALLQLLRGSAPDPPLSEGEQRSLLDLTDRTHCSLYWTPDQNRLAKNAERRSRLWLAYDEAAAALSNRGIYFVLLKGFAHEADSGLDPARRYQSDLDLLCLPEDLDRARAALRQAGYGEHGPAELSDNHARPLVKPFTWRWRGDYFDPDLPISIELHHTLWSRGRDRIRVPELGEFWSRRTVLVIEGRAIPALAEPDRIAFAALHLLRHVLRNNASPSHAFELACALNRRAHNEAFWQAWTQTHDPQLRALQAVAFQFAARWFGCTLSPEVERECRSLPEPVHAWFRDYAFSPLVNLVEPNKDVLWLHMALLPRRFDRFAVAVRKLIPVRLPRPTEREERWSRIRYHAVALARVVLAGSRRRRPTAPSTASQTSD
jgi:putative nucleotidyltransferase-like protein